MSFLAALALLAMIAPASADDCPDLAVSTSTSPSAPRTEALESVACAIENDKDVQIMGSFPPTSYQLVAGGACLDTRCAKTESKIQTIIEKTFNDVSACIQGLAAIHASKEANSAMRDALAGKPLSADALAALRTSAAARNAVQLERLKHIDPSLLDIVDTDEQYFLTADDGKARRATNSEIKTMLNERVGHPLRLFCYDTGTSFTYVRNTGQTLLGEQVNIELSLSLGAEASLPGMPSWPTISLDTTSLILQKNRSPQSMPSILSHEMMHLLGYTHAEGKTDRTLPLFSACQICCFPAGLREEQLERPQCDRRGKGSLHQRACDICAGKTTLEEFAPTRSAYFEAVRECYVIGNPL